MTATDRRTLAALGGLALLLRLLGPLDRGLWFDEILTLLDYGRAPFARLVTTFGIDNNHPLYSLLAWISLRALGESPFALRLPAVLFGVVSVGALYLYASRFTGRGEALAASLLLATSYHHVWFSQNARGYTLLLTLTLAATALFEDLLAGEARRVGPYALVTGLATYVHLGAVFVAAAHGLVFLVARQRRATPRAGWRPLGALAGAAAVSLLLYAPMLGGMWRFFTGPGAGPPLLRQAWYSPLWSVAAAAQSLGLGLVPGLVATTAGGAVVAWGAFDYGRRSPLRLALFLLPGVLIVVALVGLQRVLWPRFFFQQAGFALLLLVRGLALAVRRLAGLAAAERRARLERLLRRVVIAGVAAAWLALLPRAWALPKQDFEGALAWIRAHRQPGEPVLTTGLASIPYERYLATDFQPITTVGELDRQLATSPGLWVVSTLPGYLEVSAPELARTLAGRGREAARFRGGVGDGDVVVLRIGAPPRAK